MYHTGRNPLKKIKRGSDRVTVVRGIRQRRLHKAFLRYHDPENWPLLREALKNMGRADLIGNGKKHLVPSFQPAGAGGKRMPQPGGGSKRKTRGVAQKKIAGSASRRQKSNKGQ
jgi:hypothetical protein